MSNREASAERKRFKSDAERKREQDNITRWRSQPFPEPEPTLANHMIRNAWDRNLRIERV